jgi:hypothetical protein
LLRIRVAALSDAISLSVALKRPERSSGGTTDSRAADTPDRKHLLTMIIGAALALACRLAANSLSWMIRVRLKKLLTVGAAVIPHQATPEENGRSSFSLEAPFGPE